jgi:hypothetical protein
MTAQQDKKKDSDPASDDVRALRRKVCSDAGGDVDMYSSQFLGNVM